MPVAEVPAHIEHEFHIDHTRETQRETQRAEVRDDMSSAEKAAKYGAGALAVGQTAGIGLLIWRALGILQPVAQVASSPVGTMAIIGVGVLWLSRR